MYYIPKTYSEATDSEKDATCNGCGTKGLGGWLVPDTLWGLDITEICNMHDWMYAEGKVQSDKWFADRMFLENMLDLIDRESSIWLKWLRRTRAMSYYSAVCDLGSQAFWTGKKHE